MRAPSARAWAGYSTVELAVDVPTPDAVIVVSTVEITIGEVVAVSLATTLSVVVAFEVLSEILCVVEAVSELFVVVVEAVS